MLDAERTIEVDADHAVLLAVGVCVVNSLASSLRSRTHQDDDLLCILSTIVAEEFVLAACALADGGHVLLHDSGNGIVVAVAALAMSKECLGILGHTLCLRMLRREGAGTELAEGFLVDEVANVVLFKKLNLLILVRGAEAVEEVDEGNTSLESSKVSNGAEVHHFLHAAFCQHGKASLTASHHIAVVTKDTQRVSCKCTGRNMEDAGQQLACNLVHIGNHEQEALAGSEGACEGTSLQRTMNGTSCTAFALHFLNHYCVAEEVLTTLSGPLVNMLRHGR